ncbi:MAG: EAL domain-containing protein [Pseudomonadota bacterium]
MAKAAQSKKKAGKAAAPPTLRMRDMAQPQSDTDRMVASIADQLCAMVDDNFDFRVTVDPALGTESLQVQKLTVLINSLLENVRRNLGALSDLAEGLEDKIRERTEKLDLIVQSSSDGVWVWNLQTGEVDYSSRWRQLLGLDSETLSTVDDWLDRVHPDDQDKLRAAIRAHLQGSKPYLKQDYRIRHADGAYRWVWCRGRCQRDTNGTPTLMAGTQTDVHAFRSLNQSSGLPNELNLMTQMGDMIGRGHTFRAMIIGMPRVASMEEDISPDDLSKLRKAIALRLAAALPFSATLGHLMGDFYTAILPGEWTEQRLQQEVLTPLNTAFYSPLKISKRAVGVQVAVGVTMQVNTASQIATDVLSDAWTSYRAARDTPLRRNVLDEAQLEEARARANLGQEIRRGLERGWFVPFFQPIVDLKTRTASGFEVLARMQHPDLGLVPPGRFIPVAEDMGLMDAVSHTMLDHALDQLERWAKAPLPASAMFLSVNLEAHQLMEPGFVDTLEKRLNRAGIRPQNLKIEIVESSMIGNFAQAAEKITRIRDLGVHIALDDFGTGYSSLEYLNELSFDLIKIDKAFVIDIQTDGRKLSMVKIICVLAKTLGAKVCVEGIEEDDQANLVTTYNVSFGQGFFFAKPTPQDKLDQIIGVPLPLG